MSVSKDESTVGSPVSSAWRSRSSMYQPMRRSVSSVGKYAPWIRTGTLPPGGRKSMSPLPSSASAPF